MKQQLILILSFIFLLYNSANTNAQSPTLWESYCAPTTVLPGSEAGYTTNLALAFRDLIDFAGQGRLIGVTEYGPDNSAEFAQVLYYCRGVSSGITTAACQACVSSAQQLIASCPTGNEAIVWYEECTVHVANRVMRGVVQTLPFWLFWSPNTFNPTLDPTVDVAGIVRTLVFNVMDLAAKDLATGYAYGTQQISPGIYYYFMAQCSADIIESGGSQLCSFCLQTNLRSVQMNQNIALPNAEFVGGLMPSCQIVFGTFSVPSGTTLAPQSSIPSIVQPTVQTTALAPAPGGGPVIAPPVVAPPVGSPPATSIDAPAAAGPVMTPPVADTPVSAPSGGPTPADASPVATPTAAPPAGGPILAPPTADTPVIAPSAGTVAPESAPAAAPAP